VEFAGHEHGHVVQPGPPELLELEFVGWLELVGRLEFVESMELVGRLEFVESMELVGPLELVTVAQ
jgi:hypothetical protein